MKLRCLFWVWVALLYSQVAYTQSHKNVEWNFDDLEGWKCKHGNVDCGNQCFVDDGVLRIITKINSTDKEKVYTVDNHFTTGTYTWKTHISEMGKDNISSIGSSIYCDNNHQIEFKVGYGKEVVRRRLGAESDDFIVYMISQDDPFKCVRKKMKSGWHIFALDLSLLDGKYNVRWHIDGNLVNSLQLSYGKEISFCICCSVENLDFMGDVPASKDNYGLFDYVQYVYHK
jgi:hypothetical protein